MCMSKFNKKTSGTSCLEKHFSSDKIVEIVFDPEIDFLVIFLLKKNTYRCGSLNVNIS